MSLQSFWQCPIASAKNYPSTRKVGSFAHQWKDIPFACRRKKVCFSCWTHGRGLDCGTGRTSPAGATSTRRWTCKYHRPHIYPGLPSDKAPSNWGPTATSTLCMAKGGQCGTSPLRTMSIRPQSCQSLMPPTFLKARHAFLSSRSINPTLSSTLIDFWLSGILTNISHEIKH